MYPFSISIGKTVFQNLGYINWFNFWKDYWEQNFILQIPHNLSKFHPDMTILNSKLDNDNKEIHGQLHEDT